MSELLLYTLLRLGAQGHNEPVLGGVIVFGLTGLAILYISIFNEEFAGSIMFRALGVIMLLLAAVSYLWPYRPWPTAA
jgi:hypothetical protein